MTSLHHSFRITTRVILDKKDKEEPLVIRQVSKPSSLSGYVFGSVGLVVASFTLLFNLCRACSGTSSIGPTGQWLLPALGLSYGLFVLVVSCFQQMSSGARQSKSFQVLVGLRTGLVIVASLLMPLALGVMVISTMKVCPICLVFWTGQLIVLFSLNSRQSLGTITIAGAIVIGLICYGFSISPATNLAAKSILFEAGIRPKSDITGLPIGSVAPEINGVARSGVIVFWTNCPPCVKESLPSALAALNRTTSYTVVAINRHDLTSDISARSKVVVVSTNVFEQYGFDSAGPPQIVWLDIGIITRSTPASAFTGGKP